MKKTALAVALVVTAALAGCHKKAANTTPGGGSDMGSAAGSAAGSDAGSAAPAPAAM